MTTYSVARPWRRVRHSALFEGAGGQLGAGLVVAAIAVGLTLFAHTHKTLDAVGIVLVVAGSVWFAVTRNTTLALGLLMLYLGLLDGYLKLATGSNYVTLFRDVLLYSLAAGVLLRRGATGRPSGFPPLSAWAIALVVIVFVQLANPDNGSVFHSLGGVRQDIEFVPLFFLTYTFVRSKPALRGFVVLLVLIGAINGVVNIIQFRESPGQLAAWGPGYEQKVFGTATQTGRIFTEGGEQFTRPLGLGSDAGDGGLMAAFAIGGIIALVSLPGRRRYLPLGLLAAALAVAGIVTAQGRAVVVCALVVAGAYVLFTTSSRRAFITLLSLGVTAVVGVLAVEAVLGGSSAPAVRSSQLTLGNLLQTTQSSRGSSIARIPRFWVDYPLGAGLGVAGPAAAVLGHGPPQAGMLDSENEFNFATVEDGVPGMIAIVGFTLAVFLLALRRCRDEPDPEVRLLVAATAAPIAGMLVVYIVSAMTPTTPGGPYLWAAGGIVAYWLGTRRAELASEEHSALPDRVAALS
jgi:hypothetical protein